MTDQKRRPSLPPDRVRSMAELLHRPTQRPEVGLSAHGQGNRTREVRDLSGQGKGSTVRER